MLNLSLNDNTNIKLIKTSKFKHIMTIINKKYVSKIDSSDHIMISSTNLFKKINFFSES